MFVIAPLSEIVKHPDIDTKLSNPDKLSRASLSIILILLIDEIPSKPVKLSKASLSVIKILLIDEIPSKPVKFINDELADIDIPNTELFIFRKPLILTNELLPSK